MFHWNWKWGVRFYYFTKFQIFNFIGTKKILLWIDNDVIRRFRTKCKATVNEFGRILLLTAMISAPAGTGSFSSFCGGCRRIITALPVGCMNRWRWIQPTNWNGLILRFRNRPFRPCVRCGSGNKNFFFLKNIWNSNFSGVCGLNSARQLKGIWWNCSHSKLRDIFETSSPDWFLEDARTR